MLYKLAHIIMSAFPWLWECVEWINDILFRIRYHKSLRNIIGMVSEKDIDDLTEFFASQPESSFLYFRPHSFDRHHLLKLIHRSSMMMHVIYMDGKIAGYCFLRCFFIGKGYRGLANPWAFGSMTQPKLWALEPSNPSMTIIWHHSAWLKLLAN